MHQSKVDGSRNADRLCRLSFWVDLTLIHLLGTAGQRFVEATRAHSTMPAGRMASTSRPELVNEGKAIDAAKEGS